jgi:hypothetical protein
MSLHMTLLAAKDTHQLRQARCGGERSSGLSTGLEPSPCCPGTSAWAQSTQGACHGDCSLTLNSHLFVGHVRRLCCQCGHPSRLGFGLAMVILALMTSVNIVCTFCHRLSPSHVSPAFVSTVKCWLQS